MPYSETYNAGLLYDSHRTRTRTVRLFAHLPKRLFTTRISPPQHMKQYIDLLKYVLDHGTKKEDRTGVGTISTFGYQMRFNLSDGFPIVTTKKVYFKGLACEMLWFLRGDTNVRFLHDHNVHIWDEWADDKGELGPVYGKQWRKWEDKKGIHIDQVDDLIRGLRNNPDSRRHVVSAWNVADLKDMALPPCHLLYQFYVSNRRLSCQVYIRSNDLFLGAPFNIAQYALLVHLVADQTDLEPGDLIYTIGDAHIYLNHLDQVNEQINRVPFELPRLKLNRRPDSIFEYNLEDIELLNYRHHPAIKAPVAV